MSKQGVYNADGEPLGFEWVDDVAYDQDEWYEGDYDEGPGPDPRVCCALGDWEGWHCQPDSAWRWVPHVFDRFYGLGPKVVLLEESTEDYLWACIYCDTIGTAAQLTGARCDTINVTEA